MHEQRIPPHLQNDVYWRVVVGALEKAFADQTQVWRHVDVDDALIDFPAMLEAGHWSGGESRFLRGLAGLWNDSNDQMIGLGELKLLGDRYWTLLIEAADELRAGLR